MEKHTEELRMEREVLQRSAAASRPKAETSQTEENAPQEEAPVPDFLAENPLGKREADISGEARGVPVK